ncbi:hypothetical protein DY218_27320 [Streptomyces triticagri]|uniref:Secreted protein n=1 Tax=Streptomyces triticagri TaxID=2293568 RepID=A0A372LZ27_9ACTN|nr:hypothetical protein [Streptomyces triticagri]RFU83620.1 hypothetical protein DY218_27320 [Streptomyces triticagri]
MRKKLLAASAVAAGAVAMAGLGAGTASAHGDGNTTLVNGDIVDMDKLCVPIAQWHWNGPLNILSDAAPNGKCIIGDGTLSY